MDQVRKREDSHLQALWLAAGAAVLAACWKHAVVGSVFEQWRSWVFVALNVLLLAILFTSAYSTTTPSPTASGWGIKEEHKRRERKTREKGSRETVRGYEGSKLLKKTSENREPKKLQIAKDYKREKASELSLSQEELNERAEAFIAMFKQHLISDAKAHKQFCLN